MKAELKVKFLQHLTQKKKDEGFTLIELLVVVIIIGILSAIAMPSFLSQASKTKQSEAKQITGAMNRAQQAYYFERSMFGSDVTALGIGINTQTENYRYEIDGIYNGAGAMVTNKGRSRQDELKSYAGVVRRSVVASTGEGTTEAILCEANQVGQTTPETVSSFTCPANFSPLK